MNGLQLYCRFASISLRGQLQYRASVIMQSVGHFLITGIEFLGVWALFDRFGNLRGWTLGEVALFYAMISITWSIADTIARGFDLFGNTVKAGEFDRVLLRPRSTVLQLIGQHFVIRRVGRFLQGTFVLVYAIAHVNTAWTIGSSALFVFAIFGGVCLFVGIVILQATSAFWTTESLEVWNAFTYGGVFMSQYPVSIYRSWFRKFFTFVIPLACVNYLPAVAILGRDDPLGTSRTTQTLAPLAGVVFLFVALRVWEVGVRHYRSTGS